MQATLSENAIAARELGFVSANDTILSPDDHILAAAKRKAIELADSGYTPPRRDDKCIYAMGAQGKALLQTEIAALTGHDVVIAHHLAHVLCSSHSPTTAVDSRRRHRAALERQSLAALLAEPATQVRIRAVLERRR